MTKRNFYLSVLVVYAAGILCFSLLPDHSGAEPENLLRQMVFNFLHIPAYAGLAVLMILSFLKPLENGGSVAVGFCRDRRPRRSVISGVPGGHALHPLRRNVGILVFTAATLFGVLNEFIQAHVPGRFFSIGDMINNAFGALVGILVAGVILNNKGRKFVSI